jgi:plastocyanin
MKRLLPILACVATLAAAELSAATVAGRVNFVTKRGQRPVINETLVWLEPAANGRVAKRAPVTFNMVTRGKALLPHVLAIPAGSTVNFPNDDPISHNLFSLSSANAFDLGLYRRGAGKSHKFDTPGVVNVYCNVHPNMSSVIHVLATPYYAFVDGNGNFSIGDVPPGRYRAVAWNEQGGMSESQLDVAAASMPAIALSIDSTGYRAATHLNKENRPYAPPRDY